MFRFREIKNKEERLEQKLNETILSENHKQAVREAKAFWDSYFMNLQNEALVKG